MITVTMGNHRLVVPGNFQMTVNALRDAVGAMASLAPSSLQLMSGGTTLRLDRVLGDYFALFGPYGLAVQAVSTIVDVPTPSQPAVPHETSYLIYLNYESGHSETEVAWPTLSVRQLRAKVGERTSVAPDTVFFAFEGALLEVTRQMNDPPVIGEGANVEVFFSIGRALQFAFGWNAAQGGTPPPTTPPSMPPAPGSHGFRGPTRTVPLATTGFRDWSHSVSPALNDRTGASEKLRSAFKCPKFLGEARHWKVWNQGFVRFLSINRLDHVIEEAFLVTSLTVSHQEDNKLVYYILEDAVAGSSVAAKYVRRAAIWNGHEAYYLLYDGFSLSGPANAAVLLGQLSHFRFKVDETPSEVTLRLEELFDDLESLPGTAAMTMNDTQKINYLLSAIRPERALASVYSQIQTEQVRGTITFEQACDDLRFRCEALRADDLLHDTNQVVKVRGLLVAPTDLPVPGPAPAPVRALLTTADKRQNRGATSKKETVACSVKGCDTMTAAHLRLCKLCYHECIAGKTSKLLLKSGDTATFDTATQRIVFPSDKGSSSKGSTGPRSIIKAAVAFAAVAPE
jgi:hypothetical protein